MNRKYRNMLIILFITMYFIISIPSKSNAGLQANKGGTSLTNVSTNGFFVSIRRMESQNGTLGKNATFDQTSYVDSSGNGIDCHMALNTEWGTVGFLAYSEYGSVPTSASDTTTSNASGIYDMGYGNFERVAALYYKVEEKNTVVNIMKNADTRYYNTYSSSTSLLGDGVGKLSENSSNLYPSGTNLPALMRGGRGIMFSYCDNGPLTHYSGDGSGYKTISSRAVVVCGEGL